MRILAVPILVVMLMTFAAAAPAPAPDPWGPMRHMVGTWTGTAPTQLGEAKSTLSWEMGLDDRVMIRRNDVQYPDRHHTDLMVVYLIKGGYEALYVDNEGNNIHYSGTASGDTVTLNDVDTRPGPRFRLLMELRPPDRLFTRLFMAQPGEAFKPYVEGEVTRVK